MSQDNVSLVAILAWAIDFLPYHLQAITWIIEDF